MSFEKDAREAALEYIKTQNAAYPHSGNVNAVTRDDFMNGAEWGYRRAIEELRSEHAPRNIGPYYPYNQAWADWLLERAGMRGNK